MARGTVYNGNIVTEEKLKKVNIDNMELLTDFIEYLNSIDRATLTIKNYTSDIKIAFCWNLDENNNKFFIDFTKRDIIKFQNYMLTEMGLSAGRVRRLRSALSSLSIYIENILDDEFENFRNIINKIPAPINSPTRIKTVFTQEQIQKLLDICIEKEQYQKACILALACYSGSRKSELLRYKVDYFNEDNLILDGILYKSREKITTKGRGKAGKKIYKYCLVEEFKPYLELWLKQREKFGIDSEWLFVSKNNKTNEWEQLQISSVDSWGITFTKWIGVDFYWHSLRHYCATYLASVKKIPNMVIKEYFGWLSLEMTAIYVDLDAEDQFADHFK